LDYILHVETHLQEFISAHGALVYALLFLIVFCETGLVVTPFLPGDSLLFAVGALAGAGWMDLSIALPLLLVAAILGDSVNYAIGHWLGPRVFQKDDGLFFHRAHLLRAQSFYLKYGGRAIVLARFVPIVRTFAPFVAGVGKMPYRQFAFYNVLGAVLWVCGFGVAGYVFGGLPVVQENMKLVILGITAVSLLPIIWGWVKVRREERRNVT